MDEHWLLCVSAGRVKYDLESAAGALFVPVGIGARFYPGHRDGRRPTPYAEVIPVLAYSRWEDSFGNPETKLTPGVMEGVGLSMSPGASIRIGLSVGYVLTKGLKVTYFDAPPTHYDGLDLGVMAITATFVGGR